MEFFFNKLLELITDHVMENTLNYIGFIILISSIFLFGLKGMAAEMGIAVAASAVFLAFANLDKFSKFKGAGFEAELRNAVDEANATIDNLKSVATPLIITCVDLMAKDGRLTDGNGINKNHQLFDELIDLEAKIGLNDETLEEAKLKYTCIHAWDMVKELSDNIEVSGEKEFSRIVSEKIGSYSFVAPPKLSDFKNLLSNISLDEMCQEQLKKVESYYLKYKL